MGAARARPWLPGFLAAASEGPYRRGDPVALPAGTAVSADGEAVVAVGGNATFFVQWVTEESYSEFLESPLKEDARVLPVRRTSAGHRFRSVASVAEEATLEEFGDWPLPGPRVMTWCLDFLRKENHSFELHHERFRQLTKTDDAGWGIAEHQELSLMLQHLASYDQCDIVNLAGAESMV